MGCVASHISPILEEVEKFCGPESGIIVNECTQGAYAGRISSQWWYQFCKSVLAG